MTSPDQDDATLHDDGAPAGVATGSVAEPGGRAGGWSGDASGSVPTAGADATVHQWPTVTLAPWTGAIPPEHPDANFLADVATASLADPLPTLERLSAALDVPVGALARYVLAKWTTAGSEAVLALGPTAIARLSTMAEQVTSAPTEQDRGVAVALLVEQVQWLSHGINDPAATYPGGGVGGTT